MGRFRQGLVAGVAVLAGGGGLYNTAQGLDAINQREQSCFVEIHHDVEFAKRCASDAKELGLLALLGEDALIVGGGLALGRIALTAGRRAAPAEAHH